MNNGEYLTAKEAAEALQISLPTLYAYVSRGLIHSEQGAGKSRAKRYRRTDVAALQARKELRKNPAKAAESALHYGSPVLTSAMTLIENGRFYYRGQDGVQLAKTASFEAVAALLWRGGLDDAGLFPARLPASLRRRMDEIQPILRPLPLFERLQMLLPLLAGHDLAAYDLGETAVCQTGARLLYLFTWAVTGRQPEAGLAAALQHAWLPQNERVQPLLNAALILCADHELNVSAFAARVVASAQATPYGVVQAGLAALQGVLHGGHTERVSALLREATLTDKKSLAGVRPAVLARLRRGETLPGFGHPLYPDGDPRGRLLLDLLATQFAGETAISAGSMQAISAGSMQAVSAGSMQAVSAGSMQAVSAGSMQAIAIVQELERVVKEATGQLPTIDLGLAVLATVARLPAGAPLVLFALGRTSGWLGQAIEQYKTGQLIRPRARYVGETVKQTIDE